MDTWAVLMQLRPYQQEAKDAVLHEWDAGNSRTLLVLPTGCGKTIVFAKISEECVRRGKRVLILAYSNGSKKYRNSQVRIST